MNWKKIFASVVLAPLALGVGMWGNNVAGGAHIPFTAGTVLIPTIPIILKGLLDLFQQPPNKP